MLLRFPLSNLRYIIQIIRHNIIRIRTECIVSKSFDRLDLNLEIVCFAES